MYQLITPTTIDSVACGEPRIEIQPQRWIKLAFHDADTDTDMDILRGSSVCRTQDCSRVG